MCGDERLQGSSRTAVQSRYVVVKLPLTHPRRQQTSCRQRYRIVGDPPPSVPMSPWPTDAEGLGVQRSGAPSKTYQLLCECSYKVRCEVVRHGERIRYCPGCRSRLSRLSVPPRGWTKTQS